MLVTSHSTLCSTASQDYDITPCPLEVPSWRQNIASCNAMLEKYKLKLICTIKPKILFLVYTVCVWVGVCPVENLRFPI